MAPAPSDRLRRVKTFKQLVAYLRDELDWPIEQDDFEQMTFEYEPQELGLDSQTAVKVNKIHQLRPLVTGQPFGIFFLDFEPKRLPVVVLRRVLRALVVKKRGQKGDQPVWNLHDLLFISAYGEDEHRTLSFAHFREDEYQPGDLPALRVLGWDDRDTVAHLDDADRTLSAKLRWPKNESNIKAWREQWSAAFTREHGEVIRTSKAMAQRLAQLAREIRTRARMVLEVESEKGPLRSLHKAFKEALIHDLTEDDFADMYAQTIAYGLLSARVSRPAGLVADNIVDMVPVTNPFLQELLTSFLTHGGRKKALDFDELGVNEVVETLRRANMEAVLKDFGDRNPDEDPVIHFYELFLKEYDSKKRIQRGVFYTPRPVVSYIVRSVHELLQTEFGLEDGLADTTTWGEMLKKHPDLNLPPLSDDPQEKEHISADEPFVQILDPATGTATFLVEVIDVIHTHLTAKWAAQGLNPAKQLEAWNEYVPRHLLPRLHGYELMMAPYAIAHMKIGLKLTETGYRFGSEARVRVYLTNALEPYLKQPPLIEFEALAHEAAAVNEVKRRTCFSVVVGNPPYSVTSANFNPSIDSLMDDYKKHVRGEQGLVALADDYLKFMRLSQHHLSIPNCGVWGMITNHGFLKGLIHRGVRKELLSQFDSIRILDLHGDSNIGERVPLGRVNENVFDIQQGVAVSIGCRTINRGAINAVFHSDLWGGRDEKCNELASQSSSQRNWTNLRPAEPHFFLIPFDVSNLDEYQAWPSLDDLMAVKSCGVKTHRDGVVIDYDKKSLMARMLDIAIERRLDLLRERYGITDTRHWRLEDAQSKMKSDEVPRLIQRLTYRPFDLRWIYYNPLIIEKGDSKFPTLRHMLHDNIALLSARIQATGVYDAVFVSKFLVEMKTAESSRSCTVFPLYLADDYAAKQTELTDDGKRPNLNPRVLLAWSEKLGTKTEGNFALPEGLTPIDILHYVYAVLHSPGYRRRYAAFLKIDFPRLPLTGNLDLFRALARLGTELTALHLLESPKLDQTMTQYMGKSREVTKVTYTSDNGGTVWIDGGGTKKAPKRGSSGFAPVSEEVWNFHIGGYQVCEKWLKDRKGRTLTDDDIAHYHKIVVALSETIRIMAEIDKVIDEHGGWPGAFQTGEAEH